MADDKSRPAATKPGPTTAPTTAPAPAADSQEEGDYVVYRQLKSVRGKPGSKKQVACGHFRSETEAKKFAARIFAAQLADKFIVERL